MPHGWIGVARGKFFDWKNRYGTVNEHNALVPRDFWLAPEEKVEIIDFHDKNPLDGYRRRTFMMLNQDIAAVSRSTTYRVLSAAGRFNRCKRGPLKKGTGFVQPLVPHEHWHVDVAYPAQLGRPFRWHPATRSGTPRRDRSAATGSLLRLRSRFGATGRLDEQLLSSVVFLPALSSS